MIGRLKLKKKKKMKKCDSRVKTRKDSLERKRENFQRLTDRANKKNERSTIGKYPKPLLRSSNPSKIEKFEPSIQESLPQILSR